ncbi:SWIM zinc finger family protein [Aeoliella sp.]|uniref:SWIM zinc finger family protein n=1 Tax=Aeoliella sp. TaxID=2795800 RepID=UPI003CCC0008
MIEIDEAYVDAAAPNASAIQNGRGLVAKGKFVSFAKSEDETLLFGECRGSGKSNYHCSCDFMKADAPTHRCNCPSRQFPCKHCLGLMYAFAQGKTFKVAAVPDDIAEKRDKLVLRREKQKANADKPRKVNKTALAKKIKAQLGGLDLLEQLTHDLVRMGMGNTTAKTASQIEEQAKQLGNAFLPGAQSALHSYTMLFADEGGKVGRKKSASHEAIYSEALDQLTRLHALIKQGRAYLNNRLDDPELKPETDTAIAAWLGHAWQLRELREAGLVETDVELLQLAFNTHDDIARREFVDTGIWMNLGSGRIVLTQTFRPYKAVKYIRSDDSFFQVAGVKELCVYPGDVNPRVRWEEMSPRKPTTKDYQTIRKHGRSDIAALVKEVKGHLKAPLADKHPVYAISYKRMAEAPDGELVIEDAKGERLVLTDAGMTEEPPSSYLLRLVPEELFTNQTLIARFRHDLDTQTLRIKPLAIVTKNEIVRLTF